jgi:branched-chain amino acid transport system permease protein
MTYESFLQALIYGLQMGVTYILVALGLTLIFSIMRIINVAHGEIYMLGAFVTFYLTSLYHMNYYFSLIIAIAMVGLFGLCLERFLFRPVEERGLVVSIIIITGLMLILQGGAQIVFGTQGRGMPEVFKGYLTFFSISLSVSRIITSLIGIALVIGVYFFVYKTKQGKAMQATAEDREAASLQGINVRRLTALGFFIAFALAAAAGGLIAPIFFIDATMGGTILFKSLSIVILGGIGSIHGAALGGLILGILESFGLRFLGYTSYTFPFLIIILILIVRPQGLLGKDV